MAFSQNATKAHINANAPMSNNSMKNNSMTISSEHHAPASLQN
jgi:hypothetical protein